MQIVSILYYLFNMTIIVNMLAFVIEIILSEIDHDKRLILCVYFFYLNI